MNKTKFWDAIVFVFPLFYLTYQDSQFPTSDILSSHLTSSIPSFHRTYPLISTSTVPSFPPQHCLLFNKPYSLLQSHLIYSLLPLHIFYSSHLIYSLLPTSSILSRGQTIYFVLFFLKGINQISWVLLV
jgi:hypothetical protein